MHNNKGKKFLTKGGIYFVNVGKHYFFTSKKFDYLQADITRESGRLPGQKEWEVYLKENRVGDTLPLEPDEVKKAKAIIAELCKLSPLTISTKYPNLRLAMYIPVKVPRKVAALLPVPTEEQTGIGATA